MTLPIFALCVLAAFRITRLVTTDAIFDRPRDFLTRRWYDTPYVEALTCPWCIGFWISTAVVMSVSQLVSIPLPGLWSFAISSVVGLLSDLASKLHD